MLAQAQSEQLSPEAAFLDFIRRLRKFKDGRRAVHIRLSQLRSYNRRRRHLRFAVSTFDKLVAGFEGIAFQMFNDDLVVVCNGAGVADIDDSVLQLRFLFRDDPMIKTDERGFQPFCDWYDLSVNYELLLKLAVEMDEAAKRFRAESAQPPKLTAKERPPKTLLEPTSLAVIQSAIEHADLTTMILRQPICAVSVDRKPEPIFLEIYTSIESLRRTLMPDVNLHANAWLFQELTRHLDKRMIAFLAHNDDDMLHQPFSLNLNVSTLLSKEFLEFDKILNNDKRGILIELQLTDIFSDLSSYFFARDFLRERGYRFCIDGVTHLSLPLIDRERLGFDLAKIIWSADLADHLNGIGGDELTKAAKRIGSERLILARCDSEQAFQVGDSLKIGLYQGHLLDEMLVRNMTRQRSIKSLADALARHRAATRD